MAKELEDVLKKKINFLVDEAMQKFLGVTINEIGKDITDKIEKNPLLRFNVNTALKFKTAKKIFKKDFITKVIQTSYGNISEVAKKLGVDRRSIHRAVKELRIDVKKCREIMLKPSYYRKEAVDNILRDTLSQYKSILRPSKLQQVYKNVPHLSKDIAETLPPILMTLKEAEQEFEKQYLSKALKEAKGSITKTAKKIGLRYETIIRKMKKLGMKQ